MSIVEESPEMLQRREVLRRAAWLLGGAVSARGPIVLPRRAFNDKGRPCSKWAYTVALASTFLT